MMLDQCIKQLHSLPCPQHGDRLYEHIFAQQKFERWRQEGLVMAVVIECLAGLSDQQVEDENFY